MNNVSIASTAFANSVTPFSPVGRQAVGEEDPETKEELFSPVEESDQPASLPSDDNSDSAAEQINTDQQQQRAEDAAQKQQLEQDQQQIRQLATRDREVRAHEAAHAAVGGQYAGAASFQFVRGPDGINYAAGGEVPISLPRGGEPDARIAAAEQVRRAALAPAEPSAQDRSIAALAAQTVLDARAEAAAIQASERQADAEASAAKARTDKQSVSDDEGTTENSLQQQGDQADNAARRLASLNNKLAGLEGSLPAGSILDQTI